MYRVGGSLTEINMDNNKEPTMSPIVGESLVGGGLVGGGLVGGGLVGGGLVGGGLVGGGLVGGGLMDDIMNGTSSLSNTPAPKIPIPDNSIKEEVMPDPATTNAILEQARTMDNNSFSASAILNAIFVYIAKALFVVFEINNKMLHNGILALIWLGIGGLLFFIASGISNTNITFIMYCCAIWIMALAVLFVIIQPYRKGV
jgi:hypothetical protein